MKYFEYSFSKNSAKFWCNFRKLLGSTFVNLRTLFLKIGQEVSHLKYSEDFRDTPTKFGVKNFKKKINFLKIFRKIMEDCLSNSKFWSKRVSKRNYIF